MSVSRRATTAALALGLVAAAIAAPPASAHKATKALQCGDTVTHSVRLAGDLTDCPGDGLVVGADGVTIDLNGHTIDGTVAQGQCERPAVLRAGVSNPGGYDHVTVAGGTVQQFDTGVAAGSATAGMSDSRVHDLALRDNPWGGVSIGSGAGAPATQDNLVDHNLVAGSACGVSLDLTTGQSNRFTHNRVRDANTGIVLCCGAATDTNVVEANSVSNAADAGVLVFESGANRIERNTLADIGDDAIRIVGASSKTLVVGNGITRAQDKGIAVETCADCPGEHAVPTDVRIAGNALTSTGDGIWLIESDGDVVTGNSVNGAGSFGRPDTFGIGVLLNGASDNRVSHNAIVDSGRGIGPGIVVGIPDEFGPSPRPVSDNVVERNTVTGQHADGILVAPVARDTTLDHNRVSRSAADGIDVLSPFTALARNVANDNAAYGIEAVAGVADGGHNRASGNGNPAQCSGVACA